MVSLLTTQGSSKPRFSSWVSATDLGLNDFAVFVQPPAPADVEIVMQIKRTVQTDAQAIEVGAPFRGPALHLIKVPNGYDLRAGMKRDDDYEGLTLTLYVEKVS